jgi:signal transduction histidine kinase
MPNPVWYRSLYWRIACGFVALLAVLLATYGLVFMWLTGRVASAWLGRSASELAATIATDVGQQLASRADLDLDNYVNDKYEGTFRSFAVVMRDGRRAYSRRVLPPPQIERAARTRLSGGAPSFGRSDAGDPSPGFGREGSGRGRRGFGRSRPPDGPFGRGDYFRGGLPGDRNPSFEFAPVVLADKEEGIVAVPLDPPPLNIAMRGLAPTLATVAAGLLVAGTAIGALLVFRPTHRRLQALQAAVGAVGSGSVGIRAPETGGDEVTALARSFNGMAGQLEQRTLALETADRARRQLVADVSHELTTPLAAIRGYVETLSMPDIQLDAQTRARYLRIVGEETDRLEHIVADLLDMARLEGGGGTLAIDEVPVAQLFERVTHRHERMLQQKTITLATVQTPDDLTIRADPNRIEQVLQNLVANAVRHTPEGGRVAVTAAAAEGGMRLVVEDTGPGIPPEHIDRVFDRFYKVDVSRTGTALPSGSGLGLSIVRAIVERHGGTITAANIPEGGARFEIFLPE